MKRNHTTIHGIIEKMSLDQKIGALLTLGFCGTTPRQHIYDAITKYHCGGLRLTPSARLFGSYVDPKTGKNVVNVVDTKGYKPNVAPPAATPSEYRAILAELQEIAQRRPLGLPLHFSFDQEGGTSADYRFGGVNIFPKPMGIRATGDPKLAYETARAVSQQSLAVGFNWMHSPVLDVNNEPENPEIYTRAYSDDAEEVAEYAEQSCRGFKDAGMIATGKHFPGRGASAQDAHFSIPVIDADFDTLWNRELLPYRRLIEKGLLPSIMIAHSIFPALDPDNVATVSPKILQGLLREKLGFDGVITTDSMTMGGIALRYGVANACALALEAGADLVLMKAENSLVGETVEAIRRFVETGRISMEALDEKVYRVLNLKYEYGMFHAKVKQYDAPETYIHNARIQALSRLVAKKSVLNVRDKDGWCPLNKQEHILVVEQMTQSPNNIHWHPGMLFQECFKGGANVDYLETDFDYTPEDKDALEANLSAYDTVIITSYYIRGRNGNAAYLEELLRRHADKKFILVTNTPYPLSIPKNARNVLLTLATSPDNIKCTAKVLYGDMQPEGQYPVHYRMAFED